VRLDGDEVAPDADDGDAGHFSRTYMGVVPVRTPILVVEVEAGRVWWCPRPPSRKRP
jgi:hypothetical protein